MKHSKANNLPASASLESSFDTELSAGKPNASASPRHLMTATKKNLTGVHLGDARTLAKTLPAQSVDVTITSPPYFDLKDYGEPNQIGFGQDYSTYLSDLAAVFGDVFRATKQDGSLWIVIDTFRRDQEVFVLPFDLVAKLKQVGWILRDVIIWKKDRTLPWTHKGTTKRIFEYVLVLAKTRQSFRYFPDRHRDNSELKDWWIRHPERYNPKGKALEEVWNFNIPKQGSWGNKHIRHFCPLPSEMVSRIISLTTVHGDVVLDPFSGTGTVLTQADLLGRRYIGFELNNRYIKMFQRHLEHQRANRSRTNQLESGKRAKQFERLIVDLRVLKYGRLLHRASIKLLGRKHHIRVFVRKLRTKVTQKHKLVTAEYILHVSVAGLRRRLTKHLNDIAKVPPLSKFGIEATLKVVDDERALSPYIRGPLYVYSSTNSHRFSGKIKFKQVLATKFPIVTPIKIKIESPDGHY
jgi:DNA modification methylase